MTRTSILSPLKRRHSRKNEYAKPSNSNSIAWLLLAALALFVAAVKCFW